ncbi:MAG: ribbon-helix-helix domain-containing protein [Acidimicrobiia bacterium]
MPQFVTRVDDQLAEAVDALVAAGVVESRSDAVRIGLAGLVDRHRRRAIGERIAAGYRDLPQSDEELAGLDEATRSLISEEPW